jgi:hypothetical protein
MKTVAYLVAFMLVVIFAGYAQNTVYFSNGNVISNAQLAESVQEKLKLNVIRGSSIVKYSHLRSKIALAFDANGNYLAISELPEGNTETQEQINIFLKAPARTVSSDLIIMRDSKIIKAKIAYESEDALNYQTPKGESASVNKKDVVAIIYQDGQHRLVQPIEEAAPLLAAVHSSVKEAEVAPQEPAEPIANPVLTPDKTPTPPVAVEPAKPDTLPVAPTPTPSSVTPDKTPPAAPVVVEPAQPVPVSRAPKPVLSEEEYKEYSRKAIQKVEEFGNYLSVIADKTKDADEKDKAIEQAVKLFMPNSTIEVSSVNRPNKNKYKVRDYLTRLKLLSYGAVKLEWTDIEYVSELKQEADGNYYGLIKGQQSFIGYSEDGKQAIYSDVTQKNVRVKLQSYQKLVEGVEQSNWEVLLGNVGVAQNK